MREIATYYSTFFILSTYISIIAVPLCLFLQKKSLINTKNSLGMIYAIIFSALLISIINPQSSILISASDMIFAESIKSVFLTIRESVWEVLVRVFSAEPEVYVLLMSVLGIAGGIGALLYLASLLVIGIKINKLKKFKKIGKLTILIESSNITPHVFSLLNKSYVVVPKHVLEQREFLNTAIRHELQHIRNGDTHSIYLWQFFKCLLWINPFIHIILSYIKNLQELRVDENLIHDKKINYKVYLKTLSWFVSEGRQQPRYSLSHSIFGWSTFKELKMRISNIHRVRPMRSQPLFCLFFLTGNIFALLVIGNSSPKFQYSLSEVQRMYMPEYMKTEFVFQSTHIFGQPRPTESTLQFGKDKSITAMSEAMQFEEMIKNSPILKEKLVQILKKVNQDRATIQDRFVPINQFDVRVIEFTDKEAVLNVTASWADIDKLKNEHIYERLEHKEVITVKYGSYFGIDGIQGNFLINKKLVPRQSISFFPNIPDMIASETSNYEK